MFLLLFISAENIVSLIKDYNSPRLMFVNVSMLAVVSKVIDVVLPAKAALEVRMLVCLAVRIV